MKKAITLNDIACALHLSRNTVSKALNGKYVPAKTRRLVLDTAVRMGYKSFDVIAPEKSAAEEGKILILSSVPLISANYYIYLIRGIMSEALARSAAIYIPPQFRFGNAERIHSAVRRKRHHLHRILHAQECGQDLVAGHPHRFYGSFLRR